MVIYMSRLCNAAIQLIEQVNSTGHTIAVKAVDAPDGFGRHRSIQFDARTSKWLAPVLDVIKDPRIAFVDYAGKGRATITFVGDARADNRDDYPLHEVRQVLEGDND
jgi:hypothetical protein